MPSTKETNKPPAERMRSNVLYMSFTLMYASCVALLIRSGMERAFSGADCISKEAKNISFMTDAGSSMMEKVQLKAELYASETEYTSFAVECTFSTAIHVASHLDDHASTADNNDSVIKMIVSFTEQA